VEIASATSSTYTATVAGAYSVEVTNNSGCRATSNKSILQMTTLPTGTIGLSSNLICPNSFVMLTANGGNSYQWYLNGSTINGEVASSLKANTAGQYSVDIFNSSGCKAKASNDVLVKTAKKPVANFIFISSCQNQPVDFKNLTDTTNGGTVNWYWNFGDNSLSNSVSPTHSYKQSGNFIIMLVAQSSACLQLSDTVKKSINIKTSVPGIRYYTVRTMKGKPYQLSARNIGSNYLWQPSADLDITTSRTPVITPLQQREYQIKITSTDGCITTDTLLVQVLNKTEVFVPKAFTPNRNGVNDLLRPITVNIPLINYFKIYNRWGQLVFETRTQGDGWNGLYKGAAQPTETYTWIFEGKDSDGNLIKANGKTILIR
jgi:gliding motility-associated-like protein